MSAHASSTLRRARQPARADEVVPHPNCQRANRVPPDAVPARVMQNVCCKLWYPTRDSNPESRVSETRAYADSASGAFGTRRSARRPQCPAEGNKKARGPCGATRAWKERVRGFALRLLHRLDCVGARIAMLEGERGQGRALVWRRLAPAQQVPSCRHRFLSLIFAAARGAGPKNKKPGALARSGFSMSDARPTAGRSRRPDERGPRHCTGAAHRESTDSRHARPRTHLAPALRIQIALLRPISLCSAACRFNEGADYE
jgi:hypothetical protein